MTKTDLRVVKTKDAIIKIFISLLEEKPFYKLTVQDIIDGALINRTTFYRHYLDKYDLAAQQNQKLVDRIASLLKTRFTVYPSEAALIEAMNQEYQLLFEERDLFLAMWKIQTEEINLQNQLSDLMTKYYFQKLNSNDKPLQAQLFASLILTTLHYELENNQMMTLEEIKSNMEDFLETLGTIRFSN